ncbi:hypothetical protein F5141DRAFT_773943 [Pisolithus sp. B1]|nr:hypothetical protein F5141DRAFT_773943 [Pisolithus sp. B1]
MTQLPSTPPMLERPYSLVQLEHQAALCVSRSRMCKLARSEFFLSSMMLFVSFIPPRAFHVLGSTVYGHFGEWKRCILCCSASEPPFYAQLTCLRSNSPPLTVLTLFGVVGCISISRYPRAHTSFHSVPIAFPFLFCRSAGLNKHKLEELYKSFWRISLYPLLFHLCLPHGRARASLAFPLHPWTDTGSLVESFLGPSCGGLMRAVTCDRSSFIVLLLGVLFFQ